MERKTEFLALHVIEMHGKHAKTEPELRFINRNHILQIRQDGEDVVIELSDYEKSSINFKLTFDKTYNFVSNIIQVTLIQHINSSKNGPRISILFSISLFYSFHFPLLHRKSILFPSRSKWK
jgi:hypothetical protein